MSQEKVDIVRSAYDAYNRGDLDAALKGAAPDCELDWSRGVGPNRGVYKLDQMRSFFDDFADTFESNRTNSSMRVTTWWCPRRVTYADARESRRQHG